MHVSLAEVCRYEDTRVHVHGWIHAIRSHKRMQFLILREGAHRLQCSIDRTVHPDIARAADTLTRESTVTIEGVVYRDDRIGLGGVEVRVERLTIHSRSEPDLPIDTASPTASGVEPRMDWRFIDLRRPENRCLFEVQTEAERAMRDFWHQEGMIEIHTPKMMATASETGAELFAIDYFGRKAYLAQSPQFYKQMAIASGFGRVFEVAPVFRANPSFTSRHDTEFTSVDVELAWIDSHEDVMHFEERLLRHVLTHLSATCGERIVEHFGTEVTVPEVPFPRITMAEATRLLAEKGHRTERDGDLDPAGERLLCEYFRQTHGHEFVFVTDYPFKVRPFYHMRDEKDERLTRSFDLLWKGLEVTTGAQREHRVGRLATQAREKGLTLDHIAFYLDFFRYGCPPHGGFGFGLTRMLMILLGLPAVREATFQPRTPHRLTP